MVGLEAPAPLLLEASWAVCGLTTFASGASYLSAKDALIFLRPPTDDYLHKLPSWALSRMEEPEDAGSQE